MKDKPLPKGSLSEKAPRTRRPIVCIERKRNSAFILASSFAVFFLNSLLNQRQTRIIEVMNDVFLGVGSNVGDRIHFLVSAVRKLKALPSTKLLKFSSVYETEPVGIKEQNDFLNAALWIQTSLNVTEFHAHTKTIEKEIGRQKSMRWGPREIDIDILLFADLIIAEPNLNIPHREMIDRKFVLRPLAEIAPKVIHPTSRISVSELLAQCTDQSAVDRSEELTKIFSHICEE